MATSSNTIPDELVAVPSYPGYFYNPITKELFSIKVTGTLKALTFQRAYRRGSINIPAGFNMSRRGRKVRFTIADLDSIPRHEYRVPYDQPRRLL